MNHPENVGVNIDEKDHEECQDEIESLSETLQGMLG